VLTQVRRESFKSRNKAWKESEEQSYYSEIRNKYYDETAASFATARLWDDGILEPEETRNALCLALALAPYENDAAERTFGTFRM
jgi:3-methylcrotonyl-CoA carboxylase beta subunit